jgi:hypothetical protein
MGKGVKYLRRNPGACPPTSVQGGYVGVTRKEQRAYARGRGGRPDPAAVPDETRTI